eukprot:TRINITY_DN1116_c0_g1_i1.p1 TRINITY_DN1116_c0_g1~~TRINITY_DN1116_c0_g1_i1.p1  ORF type:complete len:129 (-),score=20.11 TRINITY_DN1116_c0_g1_i1:624-1010(-)
MKGPLPPRLSGCLSLLLLLLPILLSIVVSASHSGDGAEAVLRGYDIMSYWKAGMNSTLGVIGSSEYSTTYEGYEWHFADEYNRDYFESEPENLTPEYGAFCAFAAAKGSLACVQPAAWYKVNQRLFFV